MRPTYELNRDPLDVPDLPPADGMALQYRIRTGALRHGNWSFFFGFCSVGCLLGVIALQLAGLFVSSTLLVAVLTLLATLYACYRLFNRVWFDPDDEATWLRILL